jgi:hypothetical protein
MEAISLTLTQDKICKSCIRFATELEDGRPFTIYVPNSMLGTEPKTIQQIAVTIEPQSPKI